VPTTLLAGSTSKPSASASPVAVKLRQLSRLVTNKDALRRAPRWPMVASTS